MYHPDFFKPMHLAHAKNIILTPEDLSVEERWEKETEWFIKTVDSLIDISQDSIIIDWGCGIGRLSKAIIDKYNCRVVGVDLQPTMLEYAKRYVDSAKFSTIEYKDFMSSNIKNKFSHCIASWVFQHSKDLEIEIPAIHNSLIEDSMMFIVDMNKKAIPQTEGFYDDGISTRSILERYFYPECIGMIPLKYTSKKIQDLSWWGILKKV